jgi:hypothetical protein
VRALAAVAALVGICAFARADAIDKSVRELRPDGKYKARLAAALALAKSRDARAVIAVSDAAVHDEDATIRRICALALEKMVDSKTAEDARELAIGSLERCTGDPDAKVREACERVHKALAALGRKAREEETKSKPVSDADKPAVFVHVDKVTDTTKKLPKDGADRLNKVVKKTVESTGYATTWPGGEPTSADLGHAHAFIVASTVKSIDITKSGRQTQIACTLSIRVAPWGGKDTGERWEANKAASASGSAKATTGTGDKDIAIGVKDCIEAVGEDVTTRQVLPFLKKLTSQ